MKLWKLANITPDTPPKHGNWGPKLPVVHRWAYDYSVPGAKEDFIPQNEPRAWLPDWWKPRLKPGVS